MSDKKDTAIPKSHSSPFLRKNKKGIELTLQTIVVFIILIVVLIVVIMFFSEHYTANSDGFTNISQGAIDAARG